MCQAELPFGSLRTTLTLDDRWTPIISIFGEVDLSNLDVFESALSGAVRRAEFGCMMVDLRGTEFIELLGMKALLDAHEVFDAHSPGGRLLVVCHRRTRELILAIDLKEKLHLCVDLLQASNSMNNYTTGLCSN